jgi:RNA methyltransferase, TrmH family
MITSTHNPRLRAAAALRERRARQRAGRFLVDGIREIGRALDGGFEVVEAFVEPVATARSPERQALVDRLSAAGVTPVRVGPDALAQVAFGDRSEGLVAVVAAPERGGLADLALPTVPLVIVLEGAEKPGNLGAVIRSADGAGASAVILADPVADPWNPNLIRASLGTVFALPLRVASSTETRDWLSARGIQVVATRVDALLDYDRVDYTRPTAIVLGSEAQGLSDVWSGDAIVAARLPMLGTADSLNLAAAAAVFCYEARRQRTRSVGAFDALPSGGFSSG